MGNSKSGNKNNRAVFFYENDPELFKEAWQELTGESYEDWEGPARRLFRLADAKADEIRIKRAEAENARGLEFAPADGKAEDVQPLVAFNECCERLGVSPRWAVEHGAPFVRAGRKYMTKARDMDRWLSELYDRERKQQGGKAYGGSGKKDADG